MSSTSLADLSSTLQQQIASYNPGDEVQRQKLLALAQSLLQQVETPEERVARMCYVDNYLFAATRVLLDLDVFQIIAQSEEPMKCRTLAEKTGASTELVERLLKHVNTQGFVFENGPDEYSASGITRVLASEGGAGTVRDMYGSMAVNFTLPEFLRETDYQNPTDSNKSAWMKGMATDLHYFAYNSRPGREQKMQDFHAHMTWKTLGAKWFEMPDIMQAIFGDGKLSSDEVLIVDVGGSSGHDLVAFDQCHPDIKGRLILEDLLATIETIDKSLLDKHHIEAKPYDFFTPQPVLEAKVYYLKMVLHDWPDDKCIEILSQLKPALKSGYSRILLNEIIVKDTGAHWFETGVDMIMMTVHSAHERRERQWKALLDKVGGLKVNKIWDVLGACERLIEIELD